MKDLRLALLAALVGACPATASPAGDIAGTWECRQAGVPYRNKPPILYVAETGADSSQVTVEVDGFAREVYGRSEISADAGGWWKVKPAQGGEFLVRPETATKQGTASMGLRFADAKVAYRCLRLPPSGVQTSAPAGAQDAAPNAELSVPPASSPSAAPNAAPAGAQDEGTRGKQAY